MSGSVPSVTKMRTATIVRVTPMIAPPTAPTTPTTNPSPATAFRWSRELEPMSRSSAMVRVRPATIVAKVLVVTIAPT